MRLTSTKPHPYNSFLGDRRPKRRKSLWTPKLRGLLSTSMTESVPCKRSRTALSNDSLMRTHWLNVSCVLDILNQIPSQRGPAGIFFSKLLTVTVVTVSAAQVHARIKL